MSAVIELAEVSVRRGRNTLLDRIDWRVEEDERWVVLGPNGAGKTTFLRMLFGLIRPDAGTLRVFDRSWDTDGTGVLEGVAGFVEAPRFYPYLTGRQNLAALARLDGGVRAGLIDEVLDALRPADGAGDLVLQGLANLLGVADGAGVDVADDREDRFAHLGFVQDLAKGDKCGVHEPRVIGAGHVERLGGADAVLLGERNGEGDFAGFAGDNDLAGRVEIGHIHVALSGEGADGAFIGAEHGCHGAGGLLAGFLHELPALGDEAQTGFEVERARCGMRGEFTQGETCGGLRCEIAQLLAERGEAGEAMDVQSRLADAGLSQLFIRAFPGDAGKGPSQNLIGAAEKLGSRRVVGRQVLAHTYRLGALTGTCS